VIFNRLADEFGWTPEVVARMTIPQAEMILGNGKGPQKKRGLSFAEVRALGLIR
jgi:hypothetical protein